MIVLMDWLLFIVLGSIVGLVSGLIGVGGGVIMVPALVLLFGFTQKMAQGTTLALLVPPIGLLAAATYWRQGLVNIPVAALIAVGFVGGSWLGARYGTHLSNATATRIFAIFLLLIAVKLLVSTKV
jgi:uncharacterized protein